MSSRAGPVARGLASSHVAERPSPAPALQRPDSHPEFVRRREMPVANGGAVGGVGQQLTKVLVKVTVERSLGPVQVVVAPESTVAEVIRAAAQAYVREGRRPLLPATDPKGFQLHYSQFSLESLDPEEKVINLGSRNFFLCSKPTKVASSCLNDPAKEA